MKKEKQYIDTFDEYCDKVEAIAKTGELKTRGRIHGRIGPPVWERTIGDFTYKADPDTRAVEVVNNPNSDPFLSRWYDGEPCRRHLGRYGSLDLIPEHYTKYVEA